MTFVAKLHRFSRKMSQKIKQAFRTSTGNAKLILYSENNQGYSVGGILVDSNCCTMLLPVSGSLEYASQWPINPDSCKVRHGFLVCLRVHRDSLLTHCVQEFEVINVVRRGESIEELCFLIEWVAESVRRPGWDSNIITRLRINMLAILSMKANGALRYEKGLVMLNE